MEKTTRITDAELQGLLEKWALPAIAMGAKRNPVIRAIREAMQRTRQRLGWQFQDGVIMITTTAFQIGGNGLPKGIGQTVAVAMCRDAAEAVACLDALR